MVECLRFFISLILLFIHLAPQRGFINLCNYISTTSAGPPAEFNSNFYVPTMGFYFPFLFTKPVTFANNAVWNALTASPGNWFQSNCLNAKKWMFQNTFIYNMIRLIKRPTGTQDLLSLFVILVQVFFEMSTDWLNESSLVYRTN